MALTQEEQSELDSLNQRIYGQRANTVSNQIEAGVDQGQALAQRAGQAFSEVLGYGDSEVAQSLALAAERNEARAARVPVEGLGDQVLRGIGTLGVAAVPTVISLPFGGGIATAATVLSSAGLNLGDIKSKELDLDPNSIAGLQDVVAATGLGALEAIPFARFKRAMQPVSEGISKTLGQRLLTGTADVVKASAVGGITEGVQDAATSLLAYKFTGTEITQEDIDRIISDSLDEAAVGAILSGPIGATESTIKALQNNQAVRDAEFFQFDEDGNYVMKEPVQDKLNNDSLFKQMLANTVGRVPDKILTSPIGGLVSVRKLLGNFVQNPRDIARHAGIKTVAIQGELYSADMQGAAKDFFAATQDVQKQAIQAVRSKQVPTDPAVRRAYDSVRELLLNKTKEVATDAGLADNINWRGEDYVPLMNVNAKKVTSDPVAFRQAAYQDMIDQGKSTEDARKAAAMADAYARKLNANGFYHYGEASDSKITEAIVEQVNAAHEAQALGEDSATIAKRLRKGMRNIQSAKIKRDNPFEQERMLSQLSENFWDSWTTEDVAGNIYAYIKATSERAAHAKKFGADLGGYWEQVREVIAEGADKGILVNSKDIKNFIDVINISQRVPTYAITPKTRKWVNRIRAFENMTLLPLAILPSLAETLIISDRSGVMTSLSATGKVMKEGLGSAVKRAVGSDSISTTVADDLGLSQAEAQNVFSSRLSDDSYTISHAEQFFFNLTLLPQFTEMLRNVSANAAYKTFIRDATTWNSTTNLGIKRNLLRKFSEAGLDANKVGDWVTRTANGDPRADAYYKDFIRPALLNVVEDTVVNPRPISRPVWSSDQRFQLLGQMKSFAIVFSNSVMRTWYDRLTTGGITSESAAALKILPLIATMIVFQVYAAAIREIAKTGSIDRWEDDDVWDHVLTGASYVGMGGFIADPLRAASFGADATSTILGPAASDANKLLRAVGPILTGEVSPEDIVESITKRLTRSLPDLGLLD